MHWSDIKDRKRIFLYAGYLPPDRIERTKKDWVGVALDRSDNLHIQHDITTKMPIEDGTVDLYQSEDVFEHIEYESLPFVINDIYRALKPGGIMRISMPDYRCDVLFNRSMKNERGEIIFDAMGGGTYNRELNKVMDGGHLWFPRYETVKSLLDRTNFKYFNFYHYYDQNNNPVCQSINYSLGWVDRTPDNDDRVKNPFRPMSIVVDSIKIDF